MSDQGLRRYLAERVADERGRKPLSRGSDSEEFVTAFGEFASPEVVVQFAPKRPRARRDLESDFRGAIAIASRRGASGSRTVAIQPSQLLTVAGGVLALADRLPPGDLGDALRAVVRIARGEPAAPPPEAA